MTMAEPGLGRPDHSRFTARSRSASLPSVPPGVFEVRVLGKYGLSTHALSPSAASRKSVKRSPMIRRNRPNPVAIGTTINGTCEGPGLDYFKFSAKKGQTSSSTAGRFGSIPVCNGTLVLYDSTGRELKHSHNSNRRDPLLDFSVLADGDYLVSLHDHMYGYCAVPGECFYRLSISTAPYLDFIYPPAEVPGSKREFAVYGRNLPGGKPAPGVELAASTWKC